MKKARRKGKTKKKIGLDEFRRHTGALIEHMDDSFKLTNEEISGIHQTLNEHGKQIRAVNQTLNSHTVTLNSHTQMIGQIMVDVEEIKNDLKQKVSYDDFAKLEKRVVRMEIKLQGA
ncbi:MAG TPA: hypothetical protein VJK09_00230 [Candidatus Paceibacterota bacterium]